MALNSLAPKSKPFSIASDFASQELSSRAIAEIATRWGFRSPAHFTRAFQARYGITPAEFRRTTRDPRHRSP
jgi:AraC-like DNA-binding protein